MTDPFNQRDLARAALQIRRAFLAMHHRVQAGHIGTGLSCIDILTYVYKSWLRSNDAFILSKGHGASSLYATLHHVGLMSDAMLDTYYKDGTLLPAHPAPKAHPQIPIATGSLGHGLPVGSGLAFARKNLDKQPTGGTARVVCLLSDGECNEGSVWEAVMFAAHNKLNNLTVVVDANGLQGFGRTEDVMNMEPFADKWRAFNFDVTEIDGHDFTALHQAFSRESAGPRCILARTVKGKGISFMENALEWHYISLKDEQYSQALAELAQAEQELNRAG